VASTCRVAIAYPSFNCEAIPCSQAGQSAGRDAGGGEASLCKFQSRPICRETFGCNERRKTDDRNMLMTAEVAKPLQQCES